MRNLAIGLLAICLVLVVGVAQAVSINHGSFGGPNHAVDPGDSTNVDFYKSTNSSIEGGGFTSIVEYKTMEATHISPDWLVGGDIYVTSAVDSLQAGDIVEIDNDYLYDEGTGFYSYWDQDPYWVEIGSYTHTSDNTIAGWLIYINDNGSDFTMVAGSGLYNLADPTDDLTTIIDDSFKLVRTVKVYRGETLANPATSSRGYTYSTSEDTSGWSAPIATSSLDTGALTYIPVSESYVDDDWSALSNGDEVTVGSNTYIIGQDAFSSIQQAIAGTSTTVNVLAGTYGEDLDIAKAGISIVGEDESTVIIEVGGLAGHDNAGIYVHADNVALSGFTLDGQSMSTPRYGIKYAEVNGGSITDVTVKNCYRTGIDLLGTNGIVLSDVTSMDNGGNGIQTTDGKNITFNNITTSGNAWGGLGIFTYGRYSVLGVEGIVITGTNSFGETDTPNGGLYFEEGNYADPGNPEPITFSTNIADGADVTIQLADFAYILMGDSDNENVYTRFYTTLEDALDAADNSPGHIVGSIVMQSLEDDSWVVGSPLTIQDAIDAASPGDVVDVLAGTYAERLNVNKSIDLRGAQYGVIPTPAALRTNPAEESIVTEAGLSTPNPDVLVEIPSGVSGVSIDGFTLQGDQINATADTSVIRCWGNDVGISNNIIDGMFAVILKGNTDVVVQRNSITGNKSGVTCQPGASSNLSITENVISLGSSPKGDESGIYLTGVSGMLIGSNTITGFTGRGCGGSGNTDITICGNTFDSTRDAVSLWGDTTFITIGNNTIVDSTRYGITIKGADIDILGNEISGGGDHGINIAYHVIDTERVAVHFNSISGNTGYAINVDAAVTETVDAEKNWFGTTDSTAIAAMVSGAIDVDPWLLTSAYRAAFAGNRLVDLQNDDGGWDWPLDDGDPGNASPTNTVSPIAKGLAGAYKATHDPDMLAALENAGDLLLGKTNNFSPSDGYLAKELDGIFGGTTYTDHVNANFYGPLAAGTYDRNGAGTLYDTAGYVNLIRTSRSGAYANLAAWDIGIGLVGAESAGADTTAWVAGAKAEIDELNGDGWYDVLGLAGAVYGLAFVEEDFDPTAGEHAAASSLNDLADILAGYQIAESGGFAWNSNYVIAYDYNETIQETTYAVLALQEVGGYSTEIAAAAEYMKSVQLCTGGWQNYLGSGENNEVTGEGLWGSGPWDLLKLEVDPGCLYVKPGDPVVVDMDVANLLQNVNACQAMLGYSSTYLSVSSVVQGGGVWDQLIYAMYTTPGEIDTAVGVYAAGAVGTSADGTVAILNLTAGGTEGQTTVVFRPDLDPDPGLIGSTYLSDMNADPVWPSKVNSTTIIIDGTAPLIDITSAQQGGEELLGTATNAIQGTVTITVAASDPVSGGVASGLDGIPTVTVTDFDSVVTDVTTTGIDNGDGTFTYTYTVDSSTANGVATIDASVSDKAGNGSADADTFNINKNQISGNVELESLDPPAGGITRTVTFVATGGVSTKTWTIDVDFAEGSSTGTYTLTDVPTGTTGLSAKTAWNLRSKLTGLALGADGQLAGANFTGGDLLPGGDLNGSNSINILDYSILASNYHPTDGPAADINGDGGVNFGDYSIMTGNWFELGDDE